MDVQVDLNLCCTKSRDANHSNFFFNHSVFQGRFPHYDFGRQIPHNNDFKMVPEEIKDATLTYTPVLRTFCVAVDIYT